MKQIRVASILAVWLLLAGRSFGWNDTGHKLVAAIAYRGLTAEEQAAVDEILRHHGSYSAWLRELGTIQTNVSKGLFIFMQASTWPDDIRDNNDPKTHPD